MCKDIYGRSDTTCACDMPTTRIVENQFGFTYTYATWSSERGWYYVNEEQADSEYEKVRDVSLVLSPVTKDLYEKDKEKLQK